MRREDMFGTFRRLSLPLLLSACSSDARQVELVETVLEESTVVGLVDGPTEQEFGRIADVQAAEDGSFFVLDGQAGTVGWFAADGAYLGGVRSNGSGPGELRRPVALAVAMTDRLAVVDPANARLNIYRLATDALSYETHITGPWSSLGSGSNLCSIGGRWFIHNLRDGFLIHEVSDDGTVARSFGEAVPTTREEFGAFVEIAAPQRNAGSILCLPDQRLIVSVAAFDSHVRAYSPVGTLQWDAALADVRPVRILVVGRALTSEYDTELGSHIGRSVVRWSPETVLVQYSWSPGRGGPEDRDYHRLDSIELSTADGAIVGRTTALPLVADTKGDVVYSFENLPFPRVRLLRRRG